MSGRFDILVERSLRRVYCFSFEFFLVVEGGVFRVTGVGRGVICFFYSFFLGWVLEFWLCGYMILFERISYVLIFLKLGFLRGYLVFKGDSDRSVFFIFFVVFFYSIICCY